MELIVIFISLMLELKSRGIIPGLKADTIGGEGASYPLPATGERVMVEK